MKRGEQSAAYYDQMYAESSEYQQPYTRSRYYFIWSVIVDRVLRSGGSRVLEIGCGSGQLAEFLLDQGISSYTGLDFSQTAINFAKNKDLPRATFVQGDARTTNLPTDLEYDVLICTEVLEHITYDLPVISRWPKGTWCLCTVPSFPYVSHVRNFEDTEQVVARYGEFFDDFHVLTLRRPDRPTGQYYLFSGVRNDKVATEDDTTVPTAAPAQAV